MPSVPIFKNLTWPLFNNLSRLKGEPYLHWLKRSLHLNYNQTYCRKVKSFFAMDFYFVPIAVYQDSNFFWLVFPLWLCTIYQSQNHKGCENLPSVPSLHVWWVRRHHVIDLGKIAFSRHEWRHNPLMGTQTEIIFSFLTLMSFILYLNTR